MSGVTRPHQCLCGFKELICQWPACNALRAFHFACQSHVDVKQTLSRSGTIVSDTTTRANLKSMTNSSMQLLKSKVAEARMHNQVAVSVILDNIQQYCLIHEEGIGKQNQLKVGTAATAVFLEDCKPGAFDTEDHISCVARMECAGMTVDSLIADIDWDHIKNVMALHWVQVPVKFILQLHPFQKELSARFRYAPIVRHHMRPGQKTAVQPLGTNSEREVENEGMLRTVKDFEKQTGQDGESSKGTLKWVHGNGASFAAISCISFMFINCKCCF
jgi:hypothetical protein